MKRLWEYAVILDEKLDKDDDVIEEAQLLVEPTYVLAEDVSEVNIVAARAIPDANVGSLERITLAVRPF